MIWAAEKILLEMRQLFRLMQQAQKRCSWKALCIIIIWAKLTVSILKYVLLNRKIERRGGPLIFF